MKNILNEMLNIGQDLIIYKEKEYNNLNSLNQRFLDKAISYSYLFYLIKKEFDEKKINYMINSPIDLFIILIMNNIKKESLNYLDLKFYEPLNLNNNNKLINEQIKSFANFYIPLNKKDLSLMIKTNERSNDKYLFEIDPVFSNFSINIFIDRVENIIDEIYFYNCFNDIHLTRCFSSFIVYVNYYLTNKGKPIFDIQENINNNRKYLIYNTK